MSSREIAVQRKTTPKPLVFLRKRAILLLVLLIGLIMGAGSPYFITVENLRNIVIASSINGVMACGMSLVIIGGGIDLSVGSILAFGGAVLVGLLGKAFTTAPPLVVLPWPIAILGALCVTSLLGLISGLVITRFRIAPFIVTLAMMGVARGLTFIYSDSVMQQTTGMPMAFSHPVFDFLGGGFILGVPMPAIVLAVVVLAVWFLLSATMFGRNIYALGGSEENARLAGIPTNLVKTLTYVIMGGLAGLSGIMLTSRLSCSAPGAGTGSELDVISAVVIGGVGLSGGEGKLQGVVAGIFIIGILSNGLNLLNVASGYQYIIKSWILVAAVAIDIYYKRER